MRTGKVRIERVLKRRCFRLDERCQIHVMEVVTASLLVIAAVQALLASHVASDVEEIDLREMENVGEDVLRTIDQEPSDDPADGYGSRLEMLLSNGDADALRENVSARLPNLYSYNLYISNGFTSRPIGPVIEPIGSAVTATRLVHLKDVPASYQLSGEIFQVQLLVWREYR
jgi:hypothetical protein